MLFFFELFFLNCLVVSGKFCIFAVIKEGKSLLPF